MTQNTATRTLAVITGASSGIGAGIAAMLALNGFDVVVVGRDRPRLDATAQRCIAAGATADACVVDLRDADCGERLLESIGGRRVDVLVHAAGDYVRGPIETATDEELDTLMGSNVGSFLRVVRALIPVLRTGPGDIVLINSTQGVTAAAGVGLFAASQHATRALADAVRHELFADGIRVLVVHAGRTATPRQQRIFQTEGRPWTPDVLLHVDDIADTVVSALRLPRRAEVSELTILPMWKAP